MIEVTNERIKMFRGAVSAGESRRVVFNVVDGLAAVLADVDREHVRPLLELIQDLTEVARCCPPECGWCHVHNWYEVDPPCPHTRAREVLKEAGLKP